jgi:hypothetical protein
MAVLPAGCKEGVLADPMAPFIRAASNGSTPGLLLQSVDKSRQGLAGIRGDYNYQPSSFLVGLVTGLTLMIAWVEQNN